MDTLHMHRSATSFHAGVCARLDLAVQRPAKKDVGKFFTCRQTRALQVIAAAAKVEEKPAAAAKPAKPVLKKSASGKIDAPRVPIEETVLLQGFGWSSHEAGGWYKVVKDNIPTIKEGGFTHIWLPPPSQSVASQGYLPGRLYNLDTPYGNKKQLQDLTASLKKAGVVPLADIVINHRCADVQSEDGTWNKYSDDRDYADNPVDWGRWAITGDDPDFKGKGNPDTGADYGPAPDLDHTNEGLRESLIDWLNWLKDDVGFSGWRFDFVKGYAPDFMNDYIGKTVSQEVFNVGEFWVDLRWGDGLEYDQNAPRQALCDWLDKAGGCTLFDFVTKGILNEAVKNTEYWRLVDQEGKQPGLTGWWPSRSVTFIDNHDTGSTQQHWPFPGGQEEVGYAYIITHPGMPCILWEHYFDYGLKDTINNLIAVRKRNGVNATSSLEIIRADSDLYLAKVGEKLIVKLGPRFDLGELNPSESDGWKVGASGNNWCVWEKN